MADEAAVMETSGGEAAVHLVAQRVDLLFQARHLGIVGGRNVHHEQGLHAVGGHPRLRQHADRIGFRSRALHLDEHTGGGGRDIDRDLVGLDLEQRLVGADRVAGRVNGRRLL